MLWVPSFSYAINRRRRVGSAVRVKTRVVLHVTLHAIHPSLITRQNEHNTSNDSERLAAAADVKSAASCVCIVGLSFIVR